MKPVRGKPAKKPKPKSSVKDPIEVYCRIRPLENENEPRCIRTADGKTVVLFSPDLSSIREVHYSFKHVFNANATQKEVFDKVALPLVQDLIQGNNGLLFTYGITSSGKTYTMTGNPEDGGLLPRCLDVIFNSIKGHQAKKFIFKPDKLNGFDIQSTAEALVDLQKELGIFRKLPRSRKETMDDLSKRIPDMSAVESISPDINLAVFVSYVEIYNNYIYDLLEDTQLDPKKSKGFNSKLLREDNMHNMYVFGVVEAEVRTVEEALELFYKGQQRRRISQTALNAESSRSHSVFTIRLAQAPLDSIGDEVLQDINQLVISQLSLVDLAGSERCVRTKNKGQNLREAGNINSSLMALRTCIEILRESQQQKTTKMVPYRETKLTHLFKTFFEGEGKIKMIVCVNPHADGYDETIHVLKFAEMTQDVLVSRPTSVLTPHIPGYRMGRGNIHREAVRRAREEGTPLSEVLIPTIYSLGPDFPELRCENESGYLSLADFLAARINRRNSLISDLNQRQDDFRTHLQAVEQQMTNLERDKVILKMDLDAREQQVKTLENQLSTSEQHMELLQRKLDTVNHEVDKFQHVLHEKETTLSLQNQEMEHIRTKMHEKLVHEKDRMKRMMEKRLAEKQAELERKMCFTDEKFRQLREILNADDWDYFPEAAIAGVFKMPQSTENFDIRNTRPKIIDKSQTYVKTVDVQNSQPVFRRPLNPSRSSSKNVAVSNPRHRRSHSSNAALWIEHKPVGNLELGTVLQPKIKKKRSVSNLEVKDVIKCDAAKYVLTHQVQDSEGEMETQLYKGDIVPSAGGGAQVIFNDVEKLRQVSPPKYNLRRKRSAENVNYREIEDRCAVAVESHGVPAKVVRKTK